MRAIIFLVLCLLGMIGFGYGMVGVFMWSGHCVYHPGTFRCSMWLQMGTALVVILGAMGLGMWTWETASSWFERKFGW